MQKSGKSGYSYFYQKLYGLKFSSSWNRKALWLCVFGLLLLYYLVPYFYQKFVWPLSYGNMGKYCMQRLLAKEQPNVGEFDAVVNHFPLIQNEKNQIAFVGNGKVGAVADYEKPSLSVLYEKIENQNQKAFTTTELLRLPFSLMIHPQYGYGTVKKEESMILNYRHGIVERLSCFSLKDYVKGVISVNHTVVAHRSRPNVFLQHIEATAEGREYVHMSGDIVLTQDIPTNKAGFKRLGSTLNKDFQLYAGTVRIQRKYMSVVVAVSSIPKTLQIRDGKAHTDSISVILHSDLIQDKAKSNEEIEKLSQTASNYMAEVLKVSIDVLLQEHKNAWTDILHTGLTIAHSTILEPEIPHPLDVNATLYAVLSSMDSKLHDKDIPENERTDLMKRLKTPDFCYSEKPTLHSKTLWQHPDTVESIVKLSNLWSLKLRKSGCRHLISEGAEGMLQAIVLSCGGLQFTEYDLQVNADSDILHNDIAFHGVMYMNSTVDIVLSFKEGIAVIEVSLKESSKLPLYACEAGCASDPGPILITKKAIQIPVYIITPASAILYISDNQKHLEDLKHTVPVKKKIALAEHIESKKESGLPLLFWIGIGSLIVLFHLYLIRMIFKEYYSSGSSLPSINRTYYTNRGRLAS